MIPSTPLRAVLACLVTAALAASCSSQTDDGPDTVPNRPVQAAAAPPSPPEPPPASVDLMLERARAAAQDFSSLLRERLQGEMAEGGAIAAVDVCHAEAPRIADRVMADHGVLLGRVAVPGRNRNPENQADDWRLDVLQRFGVAVDDGAPAADQVALITDDLPEGVALRMMRGIATESGCLACHGSQVDPEVRAAILHLYPEDRATGFEVGDLRGALWVEVPLTPSSSTTSGETP